MHRGMAFAHGIRCNCTRGLAIFPTALKPTG